MPVLSIGDRRLGAILLQLGYVSDADLQKALERHAEIGGRLSDILIESGMVSERRIARAIEDELSYPLVNLVALKPPPEVTALIEGERAQELQALPFALENDKLRVAFVDPLNTMAVELIEDLTGYTVEPYQALRDQMKWAVANFYPELGLEIPDIDKIASSEDERLGHRLLRHRLITEKQLEEALALQEPGGEPLGKLLINLGYLREADLYGVLAEQADVPFMASVAELEIPDEVSSLMLRSDAVKLQAVPIRDDGDAYMVVTTDPKKRPDIQALFSKVVKVTMVPPSELEFLIERIYAQKGRLGESLVQSGKVNREQLAEALKVQRKAGKSKPLGEVLVELGYVSGDEVERALAKQRAGGGRLEDTLVQSGKLSPEMLARSLAVQLGYEYINPNEVAPDPTVLTLIPEAQARRYTLFPYKMQGASLVVIMKDPRNVFALDDLRLMTGRDIVPAVSPEQDIVKLIDRFYAASANDVDKLNQELAQLGRTQEAAKVVEEIDSSLDDNAIVRTVDTIIREAIIQEASDIHIEPTVDKINVRLRIDGSLRHYMELPKSAGASVAARIKIMASLDIAERRVPQDGRVRFRSKNISTDLRTSTLPTVYGEKVVMRILQKATNIPEIEDLGFSEFNFQRFQDTILKPYGIFLITGPTGSGKSFTTFSALKRIATPDVNVTTIEDPVEYEIPGINQSQVNNAAGMTFARALRAFLRQDPDVIMVGEIRDTETAKIAVEAALTGHLVIGTLHTNDAAGAITRLEEMGVELFNISASLIGVLAQRLVRRICKGCKVEVAPDPEVLRRLGLSDNELIGAKLFRGVGCEKCNGTGYKGRMAIHELMTIEEPVRHAIILEKSASEIKDVAITDTGMKTLRQDGLEKALQGHTTLEEILSATNE
jgi:type IV pilus assembly protein PilB